ncbi:MULTISPECIES: DsbA family protein [Micrococcales]|jgi:protein-disulfide isomerase|uniref:Disulfide bond formation protein DsbA n=1 Tax=Janibacter hoylei PVAS-1 TaxID=1210046 RepID=K1EQA6_9MICO|nr:MULTISPECIES: thioredoxin domain-containing protein [Micrococcales]EKA61408.1 thioredoxin domain-containing protein [Janibacter hoylei PVAS-1]MCT1617961.1 thioredoxin domain-containing protein [Janibacter hoylei]MCT2292072.1 thioredoxin domain-containing protein [Janibacter hoylei]MCW4601709.1 thioredoxin domain-containing protein [Janibacter hoylei]RWU84391.1 disulfide bond formation protein DsbA [Janibacter hoylei PVAS-1]
MSKSLKLSMAMIVAVLVALVAAVTFSRAGEEAAPTGSGSGASAPLVRDDSPRLTSGKKAVFVEYLDFECEACGAAHPVMTDLREKYGKDVTFVVRYLPLHGNSMNAALAAEAAREQDKFEEMHDKLFETQAEWSHSESSKEKTFEGYAQELGLDMKQYRASLKDPAAAQRIEQSKKDAQTLGVTGTPTFFLDGEKIEPTTIADFETKLDAAIED